MKDDNRATTELFQARHRIVKLEAELDVANKESEEYLRKLTELEADIDMLLKQPQGQVAFNAGMEQAAEIVEGGIMKEGNYLWIAKVNEYLRYASKAIRKEIDNV